MRRSDDAKVAEQQFLIAAQQQIVGLDIAMHQPLLVGMVQGRGHLLDIGNDRREGKTSTPRVQIAQGTVGRVVHHGEGLPTFHAELEDLDNMRVTQIAGGACLLQKIGNLFVGQASGEDFDGGMVV